MRAIRDYLLEIFLAIVSLALLLMIVSPYWFGYTMQDDYEDILTNFAASTDYSYEVISYNRSWFTTDAVLLVKDSSAQALAYLKHQIVHGPVYFGLLLQGRSPWVSMVIKANWLPADIHQPLLAQVMSPDESVNLLAIIHHNRDAEISLMIPALNAAVNEVVYQTSAMALDLQYRSAGNHFIGQLNLPFVSAKNGHHLQVDNTVFSFNQTYEKQSFSGDAVLSLASLKLKSKNEMIDVRQLSSRVINSNDGSGPSFKLDINASKINLFNEQVNSLNISSVVGGIAFKQTEGRAVNAISLAAIQYDKIQIKPFSFFTEHGTFRADLSLSDLRKKRNIFSKGFQYNKPVLNFDISVGLFKRIYDVIASNLFAPIQESRFFLNKFIALNYLINNQGKIQLRLSSRDDKIIINDHFINFNELSSQFLSAVSLK